MIHPVRLGGIAKRIGKWLKEPLRMSLFLIVVVVMVIGIYFAWRHFGREADTSRTALTGAEQQEKMDAEETAGYLKDKDYTHYQTNMQNLAREYLDYGSSADAERLMNELFAKVTEKDVNPASYSVMVEVQQAKNNKALQKKYLALYISKLRAVGNDKDADLAQKNMDKLQ